MTIQLREISDNDQFLLYLYKGVIESDHPTYLLVKLEYTDDWGDDVDFKYHCEVIAAGPDWPSRENLKGFLDGMCMTLEEFDGMCLEGKLQYMVESGLCAHLWQDSGNNKASLIKAAREEVAKYTVFFGFAMDRYQNRIGATGWDWIKGELYPEHMREDTPVK